MRQKKPTLFFSFSTTAAAMEAEAVCKRRGVPGRLVPIPREITAGCGLAWMSAPAREAELRAFFAEQGLDYEGVWKLDF